MEDVLYKNTGIRQIVIDEIIYFAKTYDIKKVILFGSRARGTHHKTSDIDLAITGGDKILFTLDVDEKTSTLLMYDIVDMDNNSNEDLKKSIEQEGVIIYEKN